MSGLAFPDISPAVPEMVLAAAAMALLILGVLRGEGSTRLVSWLSIGVLILVFVIAALGGGDRRVGFYGMFVTDAFALFMKALVLIGSAVTILMGRRYNEDQGIARFEFPVLVLLATTGMFLGLAYMLYLYRRVIFGTITRADLRGMLDLSPREKAVFAPLLVLVLWIGFYPNSFLRPIQVSVDHLVQQVTAATDAAGLRRASLP